MQINIRKTLAAIAVAALSPLALAQTASISAIKANIERFTQGQVKIDKVQPTPVAGIYQVDSEGEIFYSDASGRYGFVGGSLVDMQTRQDLTAPAQDKLLAVPFSSLPLHLAIKEVHGDGTRKVAVFEDPNCPICRAFTKFLDELPDVTVYRFMFPVLDASSQELARTAWCSADRAGTWRAIMAEGKHPTGPQDCDVSGLVQILQFAEKNQVQNTPTVFLGNGKRLVGATPPEQFIAELNASGQQ
ncbi:MAG: DsbC family protein [Desulfovibrionaceae bacterium]|nr:DsbC family protein [Desulfovibrionaceae bacterium]